MPDFLFGVGFDGRGWLAYTLSGFTLGLLVLNFALVSTALYTWIERRLIGRFQARLGPNSGAITIAPITTATLSSKSPIATTTVDNNISNK